MLLLHPCGESSTTAKLCNRLAILLQNPVAAHDAPVRLDCARAARLDSSAAISLKYKVRRGVRSAP
jgi:uncharacterized metal-binding protein